MQEGYQNPYTVCQNQGMKDPGQGTPKDTVQGMEDGVLVEQEEAPLKASLMVQNYWVTQASLPFCEPEDTVVLWCMPSFTTIPRTVWQRRTTRSSPRQPDQKD
jgi:hypothetical protein